MGIKGLSKVIADNAPNALKEMPIKSCFGRKVAIDASMSIYQFLIAVRQQDGMQLTNEAGDVTSHLMGILYRTIRMMENGIKPVYVFDGKPPDMKSNELKKRGEKREDAEKAVATALEDGDTENFDKFSRRTVKVTKEQNKECMRLLKLMGVPYVEVAPSEAEAQCAALAKAGKVYAAGSEDMDTLTFGSPVLLRHLTFSEARKLPICEIDLTKALEGLKMTTEQFIDMCILLGCDYCDSIRGIGPTRAVTLIREHGSIENILKNLDKEKYPVPEDWPYQQARELFKNPDVHNPDTLDLKWDAPDEEGIIQFLVNEKSFNEERVRSAVKKLEKCRSGTVQGRLADYFKPIPSTNTKVAPKPGAAGKRKAEPAKSGAKKAQKRRYVEKSRLEEVSDSSQKNCHNDLPPSTLHNMERVLDEVDEYMQAQAALSKKMLESFMCLAQAKYVMGPTALSQLSYDRRMSSQKNILITKTSEALPRFQLVDAIPIPRHEKSASTTPKDDSKLRRRKKESTAATEQANESKPKPDKEDDGDESRKDLEDVPQSPSDPLKMFGILVPTHLRNAQSGFRDSLEIIVKLACLKMSLQEGIAFLYLFAVVMAAVLLFAMVFYIIMFSDLECDYINPIDLCNKLNQFVLPENFAHGFLWLMFLLTGSWISLLINTPLLVYHANKYACPPFKPVEHMEAILT
ncbi:Elongation of fatty acids protein 2 [Chytridiales sp. JEL 0842]|nr:Elongation of fatty acids protein 2 [Chytridiales sp. JEL 0842]